MANDAHVHLGWALEEGVEVGPGLLVDELRIDAANVLDALKATQEVWERYPVRVLDAPKGGGKTYALARVARSRLVLINDRKALTAKNAERFDAEMRRDPGSTPAAIHHQATNAARYAATLHTTPRLFARDVANDDLIVDEAIHVLRTLLSGRELKGPRRSEVESAFRGLIANSGGVWLAQAGWSADYLGAVLRYLARAGRSGRVLVVRVQTPEERGVATEAPSPEDLRCRALDAASRGPVVYASTSRKQGERVRAEAARMGLNPLVVSARTLHTSRVQRWLARPTAAAEPFVILSPTVVSGLSIDARSDGSPEYPQVFMELRHWPGGLTLDDAQQMVARVRGQPRLTFHAPSTVVHLRTPNAISDEDEAAASASARLGRRALRPASSLDGIAAILRAADMASLAPTPRDAFIGGLMRDGWHVKPCVPLAAPPAEMKRWREARRAADDDYIADLACPDRGPVDQQTVERRLCELALPATAAALEGDALAGIDWLERTHPCDDPLGLLLAIVTPATALDADRAAAEHACVRADLRHEGLRVELLKGAFASANLDIARLVRGAVVPGVRSTDLTAFVSYCYRYEHELLHLFGVQAPRGRGGAIRVLGSLLARVGAESAGSSRPGASERVRAYSFKLAPVALGCLARRFDGAVPTPPPVSGEVFRRSAEDALRARVPVRVLPGAADQLREVAERAAGAREGGERRRLNAAVEMVRRAMPTGRGAGGKPRSRLLDGLIFAKRRRREGSGRIHLLDDPLQTLPKTLRGVVAPEIAGDVFVSADMRSCHVAVAAARTGDLLLIQLAGSEDAYADLARRYLPGKEDGRGMMKKVMLALLNGAGGARIGDVVGEATLGRRIHRELLAQLPGLRAAFAEAKRLFALPGPSVEVPTITGLPRTITKPEGSTWRRVVSAMWAGPEAEALDKVLEDLTVGARLVAPMHDGFLVCCEEGDAPRVSAALRALVTAAARDAGFCVGVKVGTGTTWAEAEATAK